METTRRVRIFGVSKKLLHGMLLLIVFVSVLSTLFFFAFESGADVDVIRPNGDGASFDGTPTGCGGGGDYDCLDDVVTEPTTPSTGSDYLTLGNNDTNQFLMQTIGDVATATAVTVWYYHVEGGTNAQATIELVAADGVTSIAGPTGVTTRTSAQWDFVTFTGLSLTQADLDGLRTDLVCVKIGGGGSNNCTGYALYADVTYDPQVEVSVSTLGTQQDLDVGATDTYIGGAFTVTELVGSRNVTSIDITETGTVDAQNDLANVELWYDIDTTGADNYNCSSESFDGNETQFGSTATGGFSAPNGSVTFTDSVGISTTATLCVYAVVDVLNSASAADTLAIEITDPSIDVTADGSADVQPNTPVALSGTSVLRRAEREQMHFHWRNDDGNEAGASSATGGSEDTNLNAISQFDPRRLRLELSNEGNKVASTSVEILDGFTTGSTKTISTGDRRLLVVGIHTEDSANKVDVDTVTYGGQTLTEVHDEQITTTFSNGMWVGYLDEAGIEASTGSTISPTWVNGAPDEALLYSSVVFENVDQRNPVPDFGANSDSGVSTIQPSSAISVADGDTAAYFTVSGSTGQTHTPAAGYTEGTEQDSGASVAANAYTEITADGTEQPTADWTNAQNRLAIVALNIAASNVYRLEYAQKTTSCSAATGWSDVGAAGGAWEMFDSANLTHGEDTTNIAIATGGVTDENSTFLTPNAAVRDLSSYSAETILGSTEFAEFEFAVEATASATEGNTYCFRLTYDGAELNAYNAYPEATITSDLTIEDFGSQVANYDIPTSNAYAGGGFAVTDNTPGNEHTVTDITITASGTVDYQNDVNNIRLFYDLDTTGADGYDCSSESYAGTEPQFGATDTDGFSAQGTSTFSGSVTASTTQSVCLYVVYDVLSGASNDETLDIQINNASTDVVVDAGTVAPNALVSIPGVTTFVKDNAAQVHYHWRSDDGDEASASSATGGAEDTKRNNLKWNVPQRLRIEVSNEGSSSTPSSQYRLEYALKSSTCSAATGWTDVGAANGAFAMFDSPNITDGDDTTNIAVSTGGVTDEEATFLVNNNAVKDTSSQVDPITLASDEFVELEYAIEATASSTQGAEYCFRVTDAGAEIDTYTVYPEVQIRPRTDFFVQRGVETVAGTSLTLTAGTDYVAPSSSSTAFIRITNTLNTGAGGGPDGNADDVTVYISNPENIENSVTFTRPSTATGDTRVAWEIIEYAGAPGSDNEIVVRDQGTATYGSTATNVTTGAVPNIADDNNVAVFITGQINPDTTTNYPFGNSTAAWNAGADTATFTRGATGNTSGVSYAVVEFTGANWAVQRSEHTYSSVGTTETEPITAVGSLTRAFLHSQKRMGTGLNTHGDFGHQVWLSSVGQVSYVLDSTASTPGSHTSVAWIIENAQTIGDEMVVTRSNGTQSGGAAPATVNVNIGTTVTDIQAASIFMNNFGDEPGGGGGQNSFPEPMMSARIISDTQYELWIADTSDSRSWRTEIVEWPTAARNITQNYYRFYVHNDLLDPTDPWPAGATDLGENTEVTGLDDPIASGEAMRIRMTLAISSAAMVEGIDSFTLQYGKRDTSCTAIGESDWRDVGDIASTTALWRGTTTSVADGTSLSTDPPTAGDLNISVSDVAGTFEEENDSALTPYEVQPGEDVEFDWVVENNNAPEKTEYCFRMVEAGGTLFDGYNFYPTMRTAGYGVESRVWQWYGDAENETPTAALAATNTAPTDVAFDNDMQLRIVLDEVNGADEKKAKFRLQFSESSSFSSSTNVEEIGNCVDGESLWCYADGGGVDNATITTALLDGADSCSGGIGPGCGSHNESGISSSTSEFVHTASAATEFAFTIRHAGALVNRVYYFRVYDVANDEVVPLATDQSYPSVVTEGASLAFTMDGVPAGSVTEGVTTDAETTATEIQFGTVPVNIETETAHRLTVDTNGTEGYQVLMYSTGDLLNSLGQAIEPVTGTNASPSSWAVGCPSSQESCVGYHTGDDTLEGGSTRFSALDTYAALSTTTPEEVIYSSSPAANETTDIVYKMEVRELQGPGQYETGIVYIATPVF